jgi:hypothetical protein
MKSIAFAVAAVMLGLAPGARAQDKPCMADAARLCSGVEPGAKQIACLKEHKQELSPACKKKIIEKKEQQEMMKEQQQKMPAPQQPPPPQP